MNFAEFYGCEHDYHAPLPTQTERQFHRALSPEVDFGVGWRRIGQPFTWHRVSWVEKTGEVYAFAHLTGVYEVLGSTPAYDRVEIERVLDGWAQVILDGGSLGWVAGRLENAAKARAS